MTIYRICSASLAISVIVFACGGSKSQSSTTPTTPTTPTSPAASQPCDPRPSAGSGPVGDPGGPYFHQTVVAKTDDGGRTIRDPVQILDHASVPDGVRTPDGTFVYYVNGEDGSTWVARLSGTSASPIGPISVNGVSRPQGIVDPDATSLGGGRIRLAYLSGFGPPGSSQTRAMCLADSTDGVNFTVVSTALTMPASSTDTDPSIVQLRDGSWLMAISRGQQTLMARSADGLSFSTYATLTYGGVPEVALTSDGRVRLYVCAQGIESYVSTDSGLTWEREGRVVPPGTLGKRIVCDPSYVAGTDLFIFKTG